jgi:transcriptional regulator with XRE-family HTH domain
MKGMNFGQLLKAFRIERRLTLRECSAELGVDASNWSKIERSVNPAPKDIAILEQWSAFLHIEGTNRQEFFDAAALSRRQLPNDIASDEKILQLLPAFFRAVRGSEMDTTKMNRFIEDLRAVHSPDSGAVDPKRITAPLLWREERNKVSPRQEIGGGPAGSCPQGQSKQ